MSDAGITTETSTSGSTSDDLLVKKTSAAEKIGELISTAFYSDYGIEVTTEEPPAADTADLKDLMQTQPAA